MKLSLEVTPSEPVEIYVNGQLSAEIAAAAVKDRGALENELKSYRALRALRHIVIGMADRIRTIPNIEDHINHSPAAKQQQFARGPARWS